MIVALVVKNLTYPVKGVTVPVDHYAIYNDATNEVAHNSPDNPGVKIISGDAFWKKYFTPYKNPQDAISRGALVITPADSEDESKTIWQRAKTKVGTAYNAVSYNCEHFTRWCCEGTAISTQVQRNLLKAAGAAGATGLIGFGIYKLYKWATN